MFQRKNTETALSIPFLKPETVLNIFHVLNAKTLEILRTVSCLRGRILRPRYILNHTHKTMLHIESYSVLVWSSVRDVWHSCWIAFRLGRLATFISCALMAPALPGMVSGVTLPICYGSFVLAMYKIHRSHRQWRAVQKWRSIVWCENACSTKVTYLYHGAATRWETPSVHQPPVSAQEICSTKVTYLYHGACPPASRK